MNMEPIEIEFKIEELRGYIEDLFVQLYYRNNSSDDTYDIEIKIEAIEDTLDFLEEKECPTNQIRNLVEMMKHSIHLLPKIMYEVDIELEKLGMCLKNISYADTATTDANDKSSTDADSANTHIEYTRDANKIDLNKIPIAVDLDLNIVNRIDLNKIKIN
jgi:hypothetical protein